MNINLILSLISILWLAGLSAFFYWFYNSLKKIIHDSKDSDFIKVFRNIEQKQVENSNLINNIKKDLLAFKDESRVNISRVGLVKYNPFNETGGSNSFSLVLLDANKNGIIITSLHTRERTRLYLKEVQSGVSKIELSKEEEKAIKDALK